MFSLGQACFGHVVKYSCLVRHIIDHADEKLFQLVLTNPNHVLSPLLPDKTDQCYYLRARRHDRQLVDKHSKLLSNNVYLYVLYVYVYVLQALS